jgi:hypothetical protein
MKRRPGRSATWREEPGPILPMVVMGPGSRGEGPLARDDD